MELGFCIYDASFNFIIACINKVGTFSVHFLLGLTWVSSINKTDRNDIYEISLKVALNTIDHLDL